MAEMKLGRMISVHRGTFSSGGWLWYLGGLCLVGVPFSAFRDPLLAAIAAGLGLLLLVLPIFRWRQSFDVYEEGFAWKRLTGEIIIPRDGVQSVQLVTHHSQVGSYQEVIIRLWDRRELSGRGLSDIESLANLLSSWTRTPAAPTANVSAPPVDAQNNSGQSSGWVPPNQRGQS